MPIFAAIHRLPFDVGMIRAVPHQLTGGKLTKAQAAKLCGAIEDRLKGAIADPASRDSTLFQLLPGLPGIDLPHDVTDAFQARVRHEAAFSARLAQARSKPSNAERCDALLAIQQELGDRKVAQRNVLVDLFLSYRAVEAWQGMVALAEPLPDHLQSMAMIRQQWVLALNRRNERDDRDRAAKQLDNLIKTQAPDPETLGILGRVHKDCYRTPRRQAALPRQRPSTMRSTLTGGASRRTRATTIPASTQSPCWSRRVTRRRSGKPTGWYRW